MTARAERIEEALLFDLFSLGVKNGGDSGGADRDRDEIAAYQRKVFDGWVSKNRAALDLAPPAPGAVVALWETETAVSHALIRPGVKTRSGLLTACGAREWDDVRPADRPSGRKVCPYCRHIVAHYVPLVRGEA